MTAGLQFIPFADPTATGSTANRTFPPNFLLFQIPTTDQTSELSLNNHSSFQRSNSTRQKTLFVWWNNDHIYTSQQKFNAKTKMMTVRCKCEMQPSGLPKHLSTHKDCICISHTNERRLLYGLAACHAYYWIRGILLFPCIDQMDSMCQLTVRSHLENTTQPLSFNTQKLIISCVLLSEKEFQGCGARAHKTFCLVKMPDILHCNSQVIVLPWSTFTFSYAFPSISKIHANRLSSLTSKLKSIAFLDQLVVLRSMPTG